MKSHQPRVINCWHHPSNTGFAIFQCLTPERLKALIESEASRELQQSLSQALKMRQSGSTPKKGFGAKIWRQKRDKRATKEPAEPLPIARQAAVRYVKKALDS